MSQYHKIFIGDGHIVRDVEMPPFKKKFRLGTIELKNDILNIIKNSDNNLEYLKYISSRIHYFVDKQILELTDDEICNYVSKNLWFIKNEIVI